MDDEDVETPGTYNVNQDMTNEDLIEAFEEGKITAHRLRTIADLMESEDIQFEINGPLQLVEQQNTQKPELPDPSFLRMSIDMNKRCYNKIQKLFRDHGDYDYSSYTMPQKDHSDCYYRFFSETPSGRKYMIIGQVKDEYLKNQINQPYSQISNIMHGKTLKIFSDGEYHEGYWVNNKRTHGRIMYKGGGIYKGGFDSTEKHSYGEYIFVTGETYTGYYKDGKRHGEYEYKHIMGQHELGKYDNGDVGQCYNAD